MLQGLFQLYQMKKKTPRRLGEATQICALETANQRQENTKLGLGGASAEPEHEVEGALLLDVVVGEGSAVLQLLAGEDQPLLVRGYALLVLDLGFDILHGVRGLHLEGDDLAAGQGLHERRSWPRWPPRSWRRSWPRSWRSWPRSRPTRRRGSCRPPPGCRRRTASAGPGGCPPCPGSWL